MTPRRCGWSPGPLPIWRDLAPNSVPPDPSRGLIPISLLKSPPSSLCQAASPGSCSPDPTWDSPAWRHPISGTQNTLQRVPSRPPSLETLLAGPADTGGDQGLRPGLSRRDVGWWSDKPTHQTVNGRAAFPRLHLFPGPAATAGNGFCKAATRGRTPDKGAGALGGGGGEWGGGNTRWRAPGQADVWSPSTSRLEQCPEAEDT